MKLRFKLLLPLVVAVLMVGCSMSVLIDKEGGFNDHLEKPLQVIPGDSKTAWYYQTEPFYFRKANPISWINVSYANLTPTRKRPRQEFGPWAPNDIRTNPNGKVQNILGVIS